MTKEELHKVYMQGLKNQEKELEELATCLEIGLMDSLIHGIRKGISTQCQSEEKKVVSYLKNKFKKYPVKVKNERWINTTYYWLVYTGD